VEASRNQKEKVRPHWRQNKRRQPNAARAATAGAAGGAPSEVAREAAQAHSAAPIPIAASATRWAQTETRNDPYARLKGQECGGVSTGGVLGEARRGMSPPLRKHEAPSPARPTETTNRKPTGGVLGEVRRGMLAPLRKHEAPSPAGPTETTKQETKRTKNSTRTEDSTRTKNGTRIKTNTWQMHGKLHLRGWVQSPPSKMCTCIRRGEVIVFLEPPHCPSGTCGRPP
jgi:hypothetical protein